MKDELELKPEPKSERDLKREQRDRDLRREMERDRELEEFYKMEKWRRYQRFWGRPPS